MSIITHPTNPDTLMCDICGTYSTTLDRVPHFCKVQNMYVLERLALAIEENTRILARK